MSPLPLHPFWASHGLAAALTLVVALGELRTGRIPTAWVAVGLAVGAALAAHDRLIGAHALGLLLAFVPGFLAFRSGHLGGGGVKWFAVVGWMVGARSTALLLGAVALAALAFVLWHRRRGSPALLTFPSTPALLVALALTTVVEGAALFGGR